MNKFSSDFFKLTVPNNIKYLEIIQSAINEMSKKIGFTGKSLYQIQLGVEEAVVNVIQHAFAEGEQSEFDIICEKIPLGIKITVKEKGIPFDPEKLPKYDPSSISSENNKSSSGLGVYLMKEIMDEVSFHNLGLDGKETCIIKYLPKKNITEYFSESELQPKSPEPTKGPKIITEKIPYDVRLMKPEEAIEVSKGAYISHGYTFFDDHIYYPDKLVELNNSHQLISAVAITKDNIFMGHAAYYYPEIGAEIAELTFVFVNPEYRGQGCFTRLNDFLFNVEKKYKLKGIYAYSVANHPYTQKTMIKYGINDCGIELATSPATWHFKGIDGDTSQRISVVLNYKYIGKPEQLTLYVPEKHKNIADKLYKNLGAEHIFKNPDSSLLKFSQDKSVIDISLHSAEGSAEIFVKKYGSEILKEIKFILRDLCLKQVASITLFLSLDNPITYFVEPELEKLGFFFSGIMPYAVAGDSIILQYLNNVSFDYDKVVAYSDVAKEILNYIKSTDPNQNI
ncbi:ATP-binding protein [Candidatus Dependentiae bacterium]|nr:ATP-binding protein [Candidatus Dependentiae bacterium]